MTSTAGAANSRLKVYNAAVQELKEPLISQDTCKNIEENILHSYLKEKFGSKNSHHSQPASQNDNDNNGYDGEKVGDALEDEAQKATEDPYEKLHNFYEQSSGMIQDPNFEGETNEEDPHDDAEEESPNEDDSSHHKTTEEREQETEAANAAKLEKDLEQSKVQDRYGFFKKATALHYVPTTEVVHFTYLKSDPSVFAVLSRAANHMFKPESMSLKEIMCYKDYVVLNKLRLRNYLYILRMLTQVGTNESEKQKRFKEVKTQLLQVKKLAVFLKLTEDDEKIGKLFERIESEDEEYPNIYDLEEQEEEGEQVSKRGGKEQEYEDFLDSKEKTSEKGDDEDEDENDYDDEDEDENDEDVQYQKFFESTKMFDNEDRTYTQALLNEEDRWVKRVMWLCDTIDKLKTDQDTQSWTSWLEAKLLQLHNLDLPGKKTEEKCSQVFYLQQFLAECLEEQKKREAARTQKQSIIKDEYTKDQQVYIEQQTMYPQVKVDMSNTDSDDNGLLHTLAHNIREKFCLKIQSREMQTDYFLTVFKRRNFGNEKTYEKRLNLRNKHLSVQDMLFHPKGQYLYVKMEIDSRETVSLIFPIQAQFKNPLLLKNGTTVIGFYGDKQFLAYQEIQVKQQATNTDKGKTPEETAQAPEVEDAEDELPEAPKDEEAPTAHKGDDGEVPDGVDDEGSQKSEEEKPREKTRTVFRVWEYDLHNFERIKFQDFLPFVDKQKSKKVTGDIEKFIKTKEGMIVIFSVQNDENKTYTYKIMKGGIDYKLMQNGKELEFKQTCTSHINFTERGDKLLIINKIADDDVQYSRFVLDTKAKAYKQENDLKALKEKLGSGKTTNFRVIPLMSDFIIIVQMNDECHVFHNETFIIKTKSNHADLSFCIEDNAIHTMYDVKTEGISEKVVNSNQFIFNVWHKKSDKPEPYTIVHEVINRHKSVNFPYLFFIYNHDQLFMKDLSNPNPKDGLYYLNNFLGIDSRHRPLTVHCFNYNNSMCLNVPVVETKYYANQFALRLHTINSLNEINYPNRLTQTMLEQRIYGFDESALSKFSSWGKLITNADGLLDNDVRIFYKGGCLAVEKWEKNKCTQRMLLTHYQKNEDPKERDITDVQKSSYENRGDFQTLFYFQKTYKLLVLQKPEGIMVYAKSIEGWNSYIDFKEVNNPELVFEYEEDDLNNPVVDIVIDTLVHGKVDLYLVQQNHKMKKFTATVPEGDVEGDKLEFVEYEKRYSIDSLYGSGTGSTKQAGGAGQGKGDGASASVIHISNIFIANQILYARILNVSSQDSKYKCLCIDLRAEIIENKFIAGMIIQSPFDGEHQYIDYSKIETRLVFHYPPSIGSSEDYFKDTIVVTPLLNSRVIPQFHHKQFMHPVVPLVDTKNGFTAVFTLNLQNTLLADPGYFYDYGGYGFYYSSESIQVMNHQNSIKCFWEQLYNVTPGILVKYYNGVEQHLPIKENFLKIDRLTVSKDGFHILITGIMFKSKDGEQVTLQHGLYLYQISKRNYRKVTLKQEIPFAVKNVQINNNNAEKHEVKADEIAKQFTFGEYHNQEDSELQYYTGLQGESYSLDHKPYYYEDDDPQNTFIFDKPQQPVKQQKNTPAALEEQKKLNDEILAESRMKQKKLEERNAKLTQLFPGFDIQGFISDIDQLKTTLTTEYQHAVLECNTQGQKVQVDMCLFTSDNNADDADKQSDHNEEEEKHSTDNEDNAEEQPPKEEEEKPVAEEESSEEDILKSVHENLIVKVNEQGHIFMINRVYDMMYFFYPSFENGIKEYKLYKIIFKDNFEIEGADSFGNHVVIFSKKDFRVLDMSPVIDGEDIRRGINLPNPQPRKPKVLKFLENAELKKKLSAKSLANGQESQQSDAYEFNILDVVIHKDLLLIRISDDDEDSNDYLKVFDYKRQILINYIETEQVMISGDKKFIWNVIDEKVYDIDNNLATMFLWPAKACQEKMNLHSCNSLDIFNVNQDRTIMATAGCLYLSFNFINSQFDFKTLDNVLEPKKNFPTRAQYFYYRLPGQRSVINKALNFKENRDEYSKPKKSNEDNLSQQQQQLLRLVNYLHANSSESDYTNCAEYFLSYFQEKKPEKPQNKNSGRVIDSSPNAKSLMTSESMAIVRQEKKADQAELMNIFEVMFMPQNPRQDIIEEILRFVVANVTAIPITQSVINHSFLNFLKSADTSQAFRQYLENGIIKTAKMDKLDKLPIVQTEQGYKLGSYVTPIMDDGFVATFSDEGQSKKDVQIQYMFLGDLLETQGQDIMKELSDSKYLNIMSIPFINYLVLFQWNTVAGNIKAKTLYPFYSLLAIFSIYSVLFVTYMDQTDTSEPLGHLTTNEKVIYELIVLLLMGNIGYFLFIEARQCMVDFFDYFSSFWNLTDLLSYSLCLFVVILDVFNFEKTVLRPLASIALIILWIKLFYFMRVYESTAQLIRMIIEIVNDMKNFLIVLFIGIIGFTGGLYIMQQGLDGKLPDGDENERFVGDNPFKAFIYTYRLTMGDFQLDAFGVLEEKGLVFEFYFIWFIFIVGSLFLVIVLLNLLIAIMGDTFSRISENIGNLNIREKVLLVSENESLFDRTNLFKQSQCLIVVSIKKSEGSQEASFETHIDSLKTQLTSKVSDLETELKSQISDTQKELKRKFLEQDEKIKKQVHSMEQKQEENMKASLLDTVQKINEMFISQQLSIGRIQNQIGSVGDQVKDMKAVRDHLENLKTEQLKFSKKMYSHLKIENKNEE